MLVLLINSYQRREYASKFYSWWTFAVSVVLTEMPYLVVTCACFVLPGYWTVGLNSTGINGFYFYLINLMFMFFAVSFGQAIAYVPQHYFRNRIYLLVVHTARLYCRPLS